MFFQVIFPLLRSVAVTVIVVQSMVIFNDLTIPPLLMFLIADRRIVAGLTAGVLK